MLLVSLFELSLLSRGHTLSHFGVLLLIFGFCIFTKIKASHYMPFFLTIGAFLAFAGAAFFAANFLFAACRVFIPCLFFGIPQPQVAHITSSSYVGRQSLTFLACHLCPYQASFALVTSSLQSSCPCRIRLRLFSFRIRMLRTYYFFFLEAAALSTRLG
jgi:hypothetical protein